jgi:hypothetical protein
MTDGETEAATAIINAAHPQRDVIFPGTPRCGLDSP